MMRHLRLPLTCRGRTTSAVATCGLLVAALVTAPFATAPADADVATFTQSDGIVIGDPALGGSSPYPSTLAVDFPHSVSDIDVTLTGLTYDRAEDLDVVLRTPSGATLDLKRNIGGSSAIDDVTVVFDTEATTYMFASVTSGRYLPGGFWSDPEPGLPVADTDLRSLETADLGFTGTWQLFVQGDQAGLVGHLTSWSLRFEGLDPTPPPPPTITGPADGSRTTGHTVTVTGTAEPGLRVPVIADGAGLGGFATALAGSDGRWTAVISDLMDGSYTVHAFTTSATGLLRSTEVTIRVHVDNTGPNVSVIVRPLVGRNWRTSRRTVTLVLGSNEPVTQMRISNDAGSLGPPQPFAALSSWTLSDREGEQRVYVQLQDPLGNVDREFDTVVLDRVAPRVTRTSPAAGSSRVRRGRAVRAQFSEPVTSGAASLSSLAKVFRIGSSRPIPATVTYNRALAIVRVEPLHPLRPGTRYRVVMSTGFRDIAGNRADQDATKAGRQPAMWRFTTR